MENCNSHISIRNSTEMGKTRKTYLDTVCGFLLCYMILHHCSQCAGVASEIKHYTYWLGFFMPWFFFKGGMFHRLKPTTEIIMSSYKRLIIPFIWFSVIGTVILWLLMILEGTFTFKYIVKTIAGFLAYGSFYGNLPLWFLLSLFAVRVLFNLFVSKYRTSTDKLCKVLWGGHLHQHAFSSFLITTS